MGRARYPWTRFWSPRGEDVRLDERGYLPDPETKVGATYNSKVARLEALDAKCLVLLGEPGMGRSASLEGYDRWLVEQARRSGSPIIREDLKAFQSDTRLDEKIFKNRKYREWKAGSHLLYLILDSLDECLIRVDALAAILEAEFESIEAGRLRLVIACRPSDWPSSLEECLIRLWGKDSVGVHDLLPLRRIDIAEAARAEGFDPDQFLRAVEQKDAVPLATRPITLRFLLNVFRSDGSLPNTQRELYERGCRHLCEERNEGHQRARKHHARVGTPLRLAVAGRIAAFSIFCDRAIIKTEADFERSPEGEITVADLAGEHETADGISHPITEATVLEALQTGLFSSRGNGRMGFVHKTYAEFLAAEYVRQNGLPRTQVASLVPHPGDPGGRVVPQLGETASWMAGAGGDALELVLSDDPKILLRRELPVDGTVRRRVVEALLLGYGAETILDGEWGFRSTYQRLDHPDLACQLRPFIIGKEHGFVSRRFAIRVAEACRLTPLQDELAGVMLDASESLSIRELAAHAFRDVCDEASAERLRPFLASGPDEDTDDELRGVALGRLWPGSLSMEEVLASLSPPKRPNLFGEYRHFLSSKIAADIEVDDLGKALDWLLNQTPGQAEGWPHDLLDDVLIERAIFKLGDPAILEIVARIAVDRIQSYQRLLKHRGNETTERILADPIFKHALFDSMKGELIRRQIHPFQVLRSRMPPLNFQDVPWMIERLGLVKDEDERAFWIKLITHAFDGSPEQIDMIREAIPADEASARLIYPQTDPVELDSPHAESMKENHEKYDKSPSVVSEESFADEAHKSLIRCLDGFDEGDLDMWWKTNIFFMHMHNTPCIDEGKLNIASTTVWGSADESTRHRIILAACRYLEEFRGTGSEWNISNHNDRRSTGGLRAFWLLDRVDHRRLEALSAMAWAFWAPVSLFPTFGRQDESKPKARLLHMFFDRARDQLRAGIRRRLDDYIRENSHPFDLMGTFDYWNDELASYAFARIRGMDGGAVCLMPLLAGLISSGIIQAEEITREFISIPLPIDEGPRSRAAIAAKIMIWNAADAGWSILEQVLDREPELARDIIAGVSDRGSAEDFLDKLTEARLETLFRWLMAQYPPEEDPIIDGMHQVDRREMAGQFREMVLRHIKNRGTVDSRVVAERLAMDRPGDYNLKLAAHEAATLTLQRTWKPLEPAVLSQLVRDRRRRIIENGAQLQDLLLESLVRLQEELQGVTPLAPALWDKQPSRELKQSKPKDENKQASRQTKQSKPKDENWLSDFVTVHLRRDLGDRGLVIDREVEIRRGQGDGTGERTDIKVEVTSTEHAAPITVIIEVKGCWHAELRTAMGAQLRDRYLRDIACRHGLYLVGWYPCEWWNSGKGRAWETKNFDSLEDLRTFLDRQAEELSVPGVSIRAFGLDARLR